MPRALVTTVYHHAMTTAARCIHIVFELCIVQG